MRKLAVIWLINFSTLVGREKLPRIDKYEKRRVRHLISSNRILNLSILLRFIVN